MIYFDNAATTWPKPQSVINAVAESIRYYSANPGRSGHKMAINAGERVYECREAISDFFGLGNPCGVVFTLNATHALNIVINGILSEGDHVICTSMDHNSVLRPIFALKDNIEISVASAKSDGYVEAEDIKKLIKPNTALIVMTHVSNVCGTIQPAYEIGKIARDNGIPLLLDASQSAGILDIDMQRDNIDFLAMPGHKALYGPMGTGILCINSKILLKPMISGGTGSYSYELSQPKELPDRYESGTLNFPGICGLNAGLRFIKSIGISNIMKHEMKLAEYFLGEISQMKDYSVIGKNNTNGRTGVISITHSKISSADLAERLNSLYNIATRAMYHCAYLSHKALGTAENGTLRISLGIFNTIGQIKTLLYALENMEI